jgi:hypothetical protein
MKNRSPNLREKYLDGERLFRKYFEMGENKSIAMLVEWAILEGMKSSTGQEPTPMGVWKSIWRWASLKENKALAYKIAKESGVNTKYWEHDMINKKIPAAWQHPTLIKQERFLKENGWI